MGLRAQVAAPQAQRPSREASRPVEGCPPNCGVPQTFVHLKLFPGRPRWSGGILSGLRSSRGHWGLCREVLELAVEVAAAAGGAHVSLVGTWESVGCARSADGSRWPAAGDVSGLCVSGGRVPWMPWVPCAGQTPPPAGAALSCPEFCGTRPGNEEERSLGSCVKKEKFATREATGETQDSLGLGVGCVCSTEEGGSSRLPDRAGGSGGQGSRSCRGSGVLGVWAQAGQKLFLRRHSGPAGEGWWESVSELGTASVRAQQ